MLEQKGRYIIDFDDFPTERQGMPEVEVENRIDNFDEVELGLGTEEAQLEAKRCLSCRRCLGCALCLAACDPKAIVFEQEDEVLELTFDDVIIAPEAGVYMPIEKGELGFGECRNAMDVLSFERMLSDDGPSAGYLLRPYDGEIPGKIAFIMDGISDNDAGSDLVSYVIKNAGIASEKIKDIDISIILPEDINIGDAEANGFGIRKGKVSEVKEVENTGNLSVKYMEGDSEKEDEFDLIVLVKTPEVDQEIMELKEKLG